MGRVQFLGPGACGKNGWDRERQRGKFKVGEWESMAVQVLWGRRNWDLQPHCPEAVGDSADTLQPYISGVGLPRVSELTLVRDGEEGSQTQAWVHFSAIGGGEGAGLGESPGRLPYLPPRLSPRLGSFQNGWAAQALLHSQEEIDCDMTDSRINGGRLGMSHWLGKSKQACPHAEP